MKEIKLNAEKVWYKWEQVPFGKFLQIVEATKEQNEIKILSIATGIDELLLRKAKVGKDFEVIMTRLKFLYKTPVWDNEPKKLGGLTMPKDITFESVEQFECMRMVYINTAPENMDDPTDEYRKWGMLAAIYYQPIKEKTDFEAGRATALMPEIESLSCVEVVSLGRFFWVKLLSLRSGIPMSSLMHSTPRRNWRRDLRSFPGRLISTLRSRFFARGTYSAKSKS